MVVGVVKPRDGWKTKVDAKINPVSIYIYIFFFLTLKHIALWLSAQRPDLFWRDVLFSTVVFLLVSPPVLETRERPLPYSLEPDSDSAFLIVHPTPNQNLPLLLMKKQDVTCLTSANPSQGSLSQCCSWCYQQWPSGLQSVSARSCRFQVGKGLVFCWIFSSSMPSSMI